MVGKYKVVTICGSTRFKDEYIAVQERLTEATTESPLRKGWDESGRGYLRQAAWVSGNEIINGVLMRLRVR